MVGYFLGAEGGDEEEGAGTKTKQNNLLKVKSLFGHNNVETSSKG